MRYAAKQWLVRIAIALSVGLGAMNSLNAQRLTWLGTLGGFGSAANGVSADGAVVVGWTVNASSQRRAFRWESGVMEDLNITYANLLTPGSVLWYATVISPNGRYIVGWGWNAATRRTEGYLLDTVPEPASLMALGVGLAGLIGLKRRKR